MPLVIPNAPAPAPRTPNAPDPHAPSDSVAPPAEVRPTRGRANNTTTANVDFAAVLNNLVENSVVPSPGLTGPPQANPTTPAVAVLLPQTPGPAVSKGGQNPGLPIVAQAPQTVAPAQGAQQCAGGRNVTQPGAQAAASPTKQTSNQANAPSPQADIAPVSVEKFPVQTPAASKEVPALPGAVPVRTNTPAPVGAHTLYKSSSQPATVSGTVVANDGVGTTAPAFDTPVALTVPVDRTIAIADGQDKGGSKPPVNIPEKTAKGTPVQSNPATTTVGKAPHVQSSVESTAPPVVPAVQHEASGIVTTGPAVSPTGQIAAATIARAEIVSRGEHTEFHLQLEPPELGTVTVHLSASAHGVSAQLVVREEAARQLLQQNLQSLRQQLADAGVRLGNVNVSRDDTGGRNARPDQQPAQPLLPIETAVQPIRIPPAAFTRLPGSSGRVNVLV